MKRVLNIILLLTSLIGYLHWGKDQHAFLFQVEYELLFRASHSRNFLHPFVLVPMLGQLLLLFSVFQKAPGSIPTITGIACLSLIMLMILLVGILSLNPGIIGSALPFIATAIYAITYNRKQKRAAG